MPTRNEILTMDGPQLVLAAFQLGLAPAGALASDCGRVVFERDGERNGEVYCEYWMPDEDVAQAREMFLTQLPALGFFVRIYAGPLEEKAQAFGRAGVRHYQGESPMRPFRASEVLWGLGVPGQPAQPTEALALLRCACLAVAEATQHKENTP